MQAELAQQLVRVFDVQVVVLLIAHDDEAAAALHEVRQHSDIARVEVVGWWIVSHSLVARIGHEHDADAIERFRSERFVIHPHVKIPGQPLQHVLEIAVGKIPIFTRRVEVAAVKEHRLRLLRLEDDDGRERAQHDESKHGRFHPTCFFHRRKIGERILAAGFDGHRWLAVHPFCASFAQASFNVMVRLKTGLPGALSGSSAK